MTFLGPVSWSFFLVNSDYTDGVIFWDIRLLFPV